MKRYIIPLVMTAILSCQESRKAPDISNSTVSVHIQRLDNDLFDTPVDTVLKRIPELREKYAAVFEMYNEGIIGIGNSHSAEYADNLRAFLTNETVRMAREKAMEVFPDLDETNQQLTEAFRYYNHYFPRKEIPIIVTYISGFNQSLMLTDSCIGIGLDKYLGRDQEVYPMLGVARYMSRNMRKEKIPSDCMRAWAIGEWPLDYNNTTLLSKMIYEGKLIYFTSQVLPNESDSLILGFTSEQFRWCEENERNMWSHLIEQKLLYSTDHFNLIKLTEDAPFTSIFPPESPGKACNWIGYRIVESYMEGHPEVSLSQLMDNVNYQEIFDQSRYKPSR